MAFRIGMRVVCIDPDYDPHPGAPQNGDVATILNIFSVGEECLLELAEFPSPDSEEFYAGWCARFFRPVRETSIECFKQYLAPTPVEGELV